ncbi:conserved Plasmodium protein, unknown function [Plasmodium berghei]|uniref:Uncharacterized protein n=2 Tax=Plasmodium berghei TaxID=5821 RepID=A0A509AL55_PLABA|nr:conserved Plasmodium protein, unknown function [Plasmodium berghei ANKA]CXI08971.1 conserved Plasmodium protein, unknown function [Plasmodium berghei]SCL92803.1 conserved Plasmodium protein, unknown function [Plasmodium berghei]SCM15721.1 conserved Plasmodium protein, unknown function [Plasmodium berghei]SCM17516.1 conserved Plasmodium protein, unknown function [Plasmodium berghei]SCN22918.1 conserved Plasmodium protein, unknown function [Plasmodium berghei]|eukprot:XP_034420327.1 conserved Plasmodium protein, unknown function [Plasmodium berghei ANKA]
MENNYCEDISLFFSIKDLEEILNIFNNAKQVKKDTHKLFSFCNSYELLFDSNCYSVIEEKTEKKEVKKIFSLGLLSNEKDKIFEEKNMNKQGNKKISEDEKESIALKSSELKNKTKKFLFNEKNAYDHHELISEEIFNCLYKNTKNAKFTKKYKLLIEIIIQAIIYANKINLDIYKLNLFLSIIIMVIYKVMENLQENIKRQKKRKEITINYFVNLLEKNTSYIDHIQLSEDNRNSALENGDNSKIGKIEQNEKIDLSNNSNTINDEKHRKNSKREKKEKKKMEKEMNNIENNNNLKNKKEPYDDNIKTQILEDENNSIQNEMHKDNKNIADNNLSSSDTINIKKHIILFQHYEAKYIIKYMFEEIFSIYNILEYLFLFPALSVNLSFCSTFANISPPHNFSTHNEIKHESGKEQTEENEFAANSYIKEALDVPLFVLDKFYDHVKELQNKINQTII